MGTTCSPSVMESVQSNICAGDVLFVLQFMKKEVFIMKIN